MRASKTRMLRNGLMVLGLMAALGVSSVAVAQGSAVAIDRVRAEGPLPRGVARRTLDGALPALRTCYAASLAANAEAAGTLELRILVSSDGGVVATSVAARSFEDRPLESCVNRALMALRFAARDAGFTTVRPTLRFGRARVRRSELQATGEGVMGGTLFSMTARPAAPGEGRVEDGRVAVQRGGLEAAIVRRALRRYRRRFLYCYERALVNDASLTGRVELRFVIGPEGRVQTSMLHGSTLGPEVDSCLVRQLRSVRFPEPEGGGTVQVRYPLTFRPAS